MMTAPSLPPANKTNLRCECSRCGFSFDFAWAWVLCRDCQSVIIESQRKLDGFHAVASLDRPPPVHPYTREKSRPTNVSLPVFDEMYQPAISPSSPSSIRTECELEHALTPLKRKWDEDESRDFPAKRAAFEAIQRFRTPPPPPPPRCTSSSYPPGGIPSPPDTPILRGTETRKAQHTPVPDDSGGALDGDDDEPDWDNLELLYPETGPVPPTSSGLPSPRKTPDEDLQSVIPLDPQSPAEPFQTATRQDELDPSSSSSPYDSIAFPADGVPHISRLTSFPDGIGVLAPETIVPSQSEISIPVLPLISPTAQGIVSSEARASFPPPPPAPPKSKPARPFLPPIPIVREEGVVGCETDGCAGVISAGFRWRSCAGCSLRRWKAWVKEREKARVGVGVKRVRFALDEDGESEQESEDEDESENGSEDEDEGVSAWDSDLTDLSGDESDPDIPLASNVASRAPDRSSALSPLPPSNPTLDSDATLAEPTVPKLTIRIPARPLVRECAGSSCTVRLPHLRFYRWESCAGCRAQTREATSAKNEGTEGKREGILKTRTTGGPIHRRTVLKVKFPEYQHLDALLADFEARLGTFLVAHRRYAAFRAGVGGGGGGIPDSARVDFLDETNPAGSSCLDDRCSPQEARTPPPPLPSSSPPPPTQKQAAVLCFDSEFSVVVVRSPSLVEQGAHLWWVKRLVEARAGFALRECFFVEEIRKAEGGGEGEPEGGGGGGGLVMRFGKGVAPGPPGKNGEFTYNAVPVEIELATMPDYSHETLLGQRTVVRLRLVAM